ncbi:hypothetical protein ILYODFUR_014687 [Ilyodon furcidens]|uniref:Uncharacterized protein n=1 Tax=Ilyodon furcidens TaxID=33524 RepID=A0ABV0SM33_9TELE
MTQERGEQMVSIPIYCPQTCVCRGKQLRDKERGTKKKNQGIYAHTHLETRLAVPCANSAESRPIPLDSLDLILVLDVVAGWLHCVTLAQPLTQYRKSLSPGETRHFRHGETRR